MITPEKHALMLMSSLEMIGGQLEKTFVSETKIPITENLS
jgi:hypothetical protein